MRVEQLSPYVRDVGVTSFGSIAALEATLNQTRMQRLVTLDGALTLTLASHKGDKSVQHLRREMRGDRYDVRHSVLLDGEGVVVDVGANLGYFTLTVAKLYPGMRVLAIEPTPPTFFFLVLNLQLNRVRLLSPSTFGGAGARGVLPLHAAMGRVDAAKDSIMKHFPLGFHDSQLAMATNDPKLSSRGGWRVQRVPLVDLGAYLENRGVQRVRVLKIDCEGCEWSLLPSLRSWLTPPVSTPGMKLRFWAWPSWWRPYTPRIERLVGELHTGPLEPSYDFEMRRKQGRPVMRPEVDQVFQTVRILTERGCSLGLPGQVYLSPC